MAVYQDKAKERIKSNVARLRNLCRKGLDAKLGEADTRAIVRAVLVDMLGWDEFEDITQEEAVKGGYCDFMIRYDGVPYAVIEVKRIGINLNDGHLRQARHYAQDNGLNWVILTDGDYWEVQRLYYDKHKSGNPEPKLFPIGCTSFTDPEVKSADRVEFLYLLSKEACRKDELSDYSGVVQALSCESIASRLFQNDVLDRIRIGIKSDTGLKVTNREVAERIAEVIRVSALPDDFESLIRKANK